MNQPPRCIQVSKFVEEGEEILLSEKEIHHLKTNNRVVYKSGESNVRLLNIPQKSVKFIKDMATTLVETKWKYALLFFVLGHVVSWVVFALLYQLIGAAHGDFDFDPVTGERRGEGKMACSRGATEFWGFLLLSVETQVTTGYGEKYPTEECPEGVFLFMAQILFSVVLDGALVGMIYAKMCRPQKMLKKFQFSKLATICQRDGDLCLLFRVADLRQQQQINSKVEAYFCQEKKSKEGEIIHESQDVLQMVDDGKVNLIWPVVVCHIIDKDSPLYHMDSQKISSTKFEIVVTLTGSSHSTGQITQARTSYLSHEIAWSHRFENIIHYDHLEKVYYADYENFDAVYMYPTPLWSSSQLELLKSRPIKKSKIISLPNIGGNNRIESEEEKTPNTDPGTSQSQSGLKMNIDGSVIGTANATRMMHLQDYDEDEDDFGDEEIDDFDDSVIQSAAAIMDRGEKKLYNKLRPNEWNAKVVSTPNIWHKELDRNL